MKLLAPATAVLLAALVATSFPLHEGADPDRPEEKASETARASEEPRNSVLVELFTSEGCSSCPPADALLSRLSAAQGVPGVEIIALEEHVDYWNQLGWTDPFSSAQFSRRQEAYAEVTGERGVYTPQMVVDGRRSFVGSEERQARQAIAAAAREKKTRVWLLLRAFGHARETTLEVHVPPLESSRQGDVAEIYLAITEDGLESAVRRGENAGLKLAHAAVVRSLRRIRVASVSAEAFEGDVRLEIEPAWNAARLHAIVFVQERKSRRVLGAASIPLR